MKRFLLASAVLAAAIPARAGSFGSSGVGTNTAEFLKIPVGARAVAMGEAYSAVADEASAMFWNPAALTRIQKRSVTFMHSAYIDSSYLDYLAYGQNLGKYGTVGMGLQYFSAGSITETDSTGFETGSFNPNDLALSFGYAYPFRDFAALPALNGFSAGMNLKYVRSKIVDSASAVAFDLGVMSPAYIDKKLEFAFTVTNLGTKMKFDSVKESLPLALRFGSSYYFRPQWLASLDLALPEDNSPHVALGTEYLLPVMKEMTLAGRFGLNTRTLGDINEITGVSFGLGFIFERLSFDYALVPFGGLSTTHRLSLSAKF